MGERFFLFSYLELNTPDRGERRTPGTSAFAFVIAGSGAMVCG